MKLTQALKMAFKALLGNKMRSTLTMLGIIIGVLAVSMLISIGQGATSQVTDSVMGMGSNLLTVNVRTRRQTNITLDTLEGMVGKNGIAAVSPSIQSSVTVKHGTESMDAVVEGAMPSFETIRNQKAELGRFILQTDVDARNAVAVIGTEVADELFGNTDVVGQKIGVNGRDFLIVGVLESKGAQGSSSMDDRVIIPFTTAQRLLKNTNITMFYVSADKAEDVERAQSYLESFLLARTKDENGYTVFNQQSLLSTLSTVTATLTAMLGGIAGISLLVGGIGIMNIMLVSVTERTREIGIRKAIGAQRSDILMQFLIEAMVLSLTGGLIGLGLGALGVRVVGTLMGMTLNISPMVAALALGFSVAVGIGFGIYPAAKASGLNPIEALRYQ